MRVSKLILRRSIYEGGLALPDCWLYYLAAQFKLLLGIVAETHEEWKFAIDGSLRWPQKGLLYQHFEKIWTRMRKNEQPKVRLVIPRTLLLVEIHMIPPQWLVWAYREWPEILSLPINTLVDEQGLLSVDKLGVTAEYPVRYLLHYLQLRNWIGKEGISSTGMRDRSVWEIVSGGSKGRSFTRDKVWGALYVYSSS